MILFRVSTYTVFIYTVYTYVPIILTIFASPTFPSSLHPQQPQLRKASKAASLRGGQLLGGRIANVNYSVNVQISISFSQLFGVEKKHHFPTLKEDSALLIIVKMLFFTGCMAWHHLLLDPLVQLPFSHVLKALSTLRVSRTAHIFHHRGPLDACSFRRSSKLFARDTSKCLLTKHWYRNAPRLL